MFISDSIKTEVVTVTPALAELLLSRNTHNRNVSPANYARVKEAMTAGEWTLNGEAIKIATDGTVLDGQHRLKVAAENDVTFTTLIVFGLPNVSQNTMDTGKPRSVADVLRLAGVKHSNEISGIAMALVRMDRYGLKAAMNGTSSAYPVTSRQVLARVEAEPSIEALHGLIAPVKKLGVGGVVPGVLYYVFSSIDADDTDHFFDRLATGEGLMKGDPILTLRNSLIQLVGERGQKDRVYLSALFIKAWNKYRDGQQCTLLRFRPGGANPERYPEPK